jgi:uncharacterized protein (UPF0261 family)
MIDSAHQYLLSDTARLPSAVDVAGLNGVSRQTLADVAIAVAGRAARGSRVTRGRLARGLQNEGTTGGHVFHGERAS